jgi:hypothetical protein
VFDSLAGDAACVFCGRQVGKDFPAPSPEAASETLTLDEAYGPLPDLQTQREVRLGQEIAALRTEVERLKVCVREHYGPEAHDHENKPIPSLAERMDDAEFERLRVWNIRYGEWSAPGEISLALDALIAEARRARASDAALRAALKAKDDAMESMISEAVREEERQWEEKLKKAEEASDDPPWVSLAYHETALKKAEEERGCPHCKCSCVACGPCGEEEAKP